MIKEGTVVSMTYILTDDQGNEIDRADKGEPFVYLHGSGQIVPGLERQLGGLLVGSTRTVKVQPEDGYGEYDPSLVLKASKAQFPDGANPQQGMRFVTQDPDGNQVMFEVTAVNGDEVELNGNHPLAGQVLNFQVEIMSIREATREELEHGHAHGPDGHHHH